MQLNFQQVDARKVVFQYWDRQILEHYITVI